MTRRKDDALRAIRKILFSGEIGQGELFSENMLVGTLEMSRTPIREALTALEKEGLVEKIPQVGVRVRQFYDSDLKELFQARQYLEPHCASALAARVTVSDIYVLEDLLKGMDRASSQANVQEFLRNDVEFHWQTAELAGLPLFAEWMRQTGDRIRILGFVSSPTEEGMKIALEEHGRILDAVRSKNTEAAASACIHHLAETQKRLEHGYQRQIFNTTEE